MGNQHRSRDLRESVAKKVTSRVKHKPIRNGGSGRPNKKAHLTQVWRKGYAAATITSEVVESAAVVVPSAVVPEIVDTTDGLGGVGDITVLCDVS